MLEIEKLLYKNHISLSRFINLCLYRKDSGFYQKNSIGKHFVTSPEVSQLFGECISIFFLLLLKKFNVNNFCELGPGNGTLMKDLIRTLKKFIDHPVSFNLFEKSVFLRNLQKKNLKEFNFNEIKINFLSKLNLKKEPYFFICNEFFDALPINQFEKKKNNWFERRVIFKDKFKLINKQTNVSFSNKFKNGDIVEESPLSNLYMKKICKHIKNFGGGILIFDYGPFQKKNIDTLQAIYDSKKCGIFDKPFKSDITYHVNFEKLKKISNSFGLRSYGPISQRKFLFFNGINERFYDLSNKVRSKKTLNDLEKQFERLTTPYGMGSLIKCLFVSNYDFKLKAFEKYE